MASYEINWPNWTLFKQTQGTKVMRLVVAECRITARRNVLWGPYTRGRLAESIYGTSRRTVNGFVGRVGSNLKYAASVEDGAERHIIRARALSLGGGRYLSGRMLHFFWVKRGYWVTTPMVRHPGQRGKHYIRDALLRTARRRGFRVVIFK